MPPSEIREKIESSTPAQRGAVEGYVHHDLKNLEGGHLRSELTKYFDPRTEVAKPRSLTAIFDGAALDPKKSVSKFVSELKAQAAVGVEVALKLKEDKYRDLDAAVRKTYGEKRIQDIIGGKSDGLKVDVPVRFQRLDGLVRIVGNDFRPSSPHPRKDWGFSCIWVDKWWTIS